MGQEVTSAELGLVDRVRTLHRKMPSGVTIVTVHDGTRPHGLAVNAFASVSLGPPSVLVCVARTSVTHERLGAASALAINVVAQDQRPLVEAFAVSGGDKFRDLSWHPGVTGAPLIDGAAGYFEVSIDERIAAGTHTIFVGRIVDAMHTDRPALLYLEGDLHDDLLGP